jgi:hypothetical protein
MLQNANLAIQTDPYNSSESTISPEELIPDTNGVLDSIQRMSGSLGEFLRDLFTLPPRSKSGRTQKHAQMVSKFLHGWSKVKAEGIVELMYAHHDSARRPARNTVSDSQLSMFVVDEVVKFIGCCGFGASQEYLDFVPIIYEYDWTAILRILI